ncbi:MAG: hypothetical protein GKS02_05550 [Alphaproteobacteria bacterium]|nr:hypothetical protein [Alphaproteobacteria bacterium]
MSAITYIALVGLPVCTAVIAYLLGFDNGYLRARRDLRETSARRTSPILGVTRRIHRNDE